MVILKVMQKQADRVPEIKGIQNNIVKLVRSEDLSKNS
jgi:hypothetical protein